jgi:ABC-type multidrug transport system fused ATPase/permease subunit
MSGVLIHCIIQVLYAYINKNVINAVITLDRGLLKQTAVMAVIYIIVATIWPVISYAQMTIIRHIMYDLKSKLFRHMESLSMSYFEKNHSGDSVERLSNNVDTLKSAYYEKTTWLIATFCSGITAMVTMFILEWKIAIILIFLGVASILISIKYTKEIRTITDKINKEMSGLAQRLSDVLAGYDVIKMFKGALIAINKYKEQNSRVTKLRVKAAHKKGTLEGVSFAFTFLSNIGVIVIGMFMVSKGLTDLGTVAGIVTLQASVNWMFLNLGSSYSRLQEAMSNASRVFEILEQKPEPHIYQAGDINESSAMLGFENVCFNYEGRENVINNISLTIKEGERAALVGPSGGGKSTVLKLLIGFYPIASGSITIKGKCIRQLTLKELRDNIAYVPQDAYLFNATIMENIRFGRLEASDEEVIKAAEAAYAHDFIEELPEGYNTEMINGGSNLSGGQRQRIAIARAFLKDAPILLLDEATSALDTESEKQVQISLEALMKNRTTLAIAHRLSTIENSDVIFVVEKGTVVEQGTSKELLEKAGLYMKLNNAS